MKNILLAVVFVFIASAVFAATDSASETGQAEAKIIAPLSLTHDSTSLNFGTLVSGTAGTVTIPAVAGATAQDSGVTRANGAVSADSFTVTNTDNVPYSIVVEDTTINITKIGGSETMSVGSFTKSCDTNTCTDSKIYIGGTLTVGANQTAGSYTGEYHVHLTY